MIDHKANFNKFKRNCTNCDHQSQLTWKLREINLEKFRNMWKLNNILLSTSWSKKKPQRKVGYSLR
jgi:hypothetical protein